MEGEAATKKDLQQLLGYCEWVGAQLAGGECLTVQPVLVAHDFPEEVANFAATVRTSFKSTKLVKYKVEMGELELSTLGSKTTCYSHARHYPRNRHKGRQSLQKEASLIVGQTVAMTILVEGVLPRSTKTALGWLSHLS